MSYTPSTDFLALLRQTSAGARAESMPGLDFIISGLARMGLITLVVSQTAPIVNQVTTAWYRPALPSWTAEGTLYLWSTDVGAYQIATPTLWSAFVLGSSGYLFQSVATPTANVNVGTTLLAIQRVAPVTTVLTLPNLVAQWSSGKRLQVVDFSTNIASVHTITLITPDGTTIMQKNTWQILSTTDQLNGLDLQPSPELNTWVIAP